MPLIVFMILSSASIKMKAAVAVALLLAVAVTSEVRAYNARTIITRCAFLSGKDFHNTEGLRAQPLLLFTKR